MLVFLLRAHYVFIFIFFLIFIFVIEFFAKRAGCDCIVSSTVLLPSKFCFHILRISNKECIASTVCLEFRFQTYAESLQATVA